MSKNQLGPSSTGAGWSPRGDALAVGALLFFAAYFALGKVARETLSGNQWWYLAGLIAFPSTGHFLVNWAHAHVSLTLVSLMTLGVPVLSILGAAILFGESLVLVQAAGIVVVLIVLCFAILETSRLDKVRALDESSPVITGLE